jgi:hypothetical protein
VKIAANLNCLFSIDPSWTIETLLPIAKSAIDDTSAFLAGHLWAARTPQPALYSLLKPMLVDLCCRDGLRREHGRTSEVCTSAFRQTIHMPLNQDRSCQMWSFANFSFMLEMTSAHQSLQQLRRWVKQGFYRPRVPHDFGLTCKITAKF